MAVELQRTFLESRCLPSTAVCRRLFRVPARNRGTDGAL